MEKKWFIYRNHQVSNHGDIKSFNEKPIISERIFVDGVSVYRRDYIRMALEATATEADVYYYLSTLPVKPPKAEHLKLSKKENPEYWHKWIYIIKHITGTEEKIWNVVDWCREHGIATTAIYGTLSKNRWSNTGYRLYREANPDYKVKK